MCLTIVVLPKSPDPCQPSQCRILLGQVEKGHNDTMFSGDSIREEDNPKTMCCWSRMLLDQPQQGGVSNAIEDKDKVEVVRSLPVGWHRRCIHACGGVVRSGCSEAR